MRFDLSRYQGTSVQSFELVALVGRDSLDALARCAPPGAALTPAQVNNRHRSELIAAAIAMVDDRPVELRPYSAWEAWSLRTQDFVFGAYQRLNSATQDEIDAVLRTGKDGRFDLTGIQRVEIKSFQLVELTGKDSIAALGAVPGTSLHPVAAGALHLNALVAQSIAKVDDASVAPPFAGWDALKLRTQEFIIAAYNRMNAATKVEIDDFFARSFGSPPGASSPPSSASTPGSPGT